MQPQSAKLKKWADSGCSFVLRDCGGGGDCLFHVLAYAYGLLYAKKVTMALVRTWLAESITEENVDGFMDAIIDEQKNHIASGSFVVEGVRRHEDRKQIMKALVRQPGYAFQGTDVVLRFLKTHCHQFRGCGFVALSDHGPDHSQIITDKSASNLVFLFNLSGHSHWVHASLLNMDASRVKHFISVHQWPALQKMLSIKK